MDEGWGCQSFKKSPANKAVMRQYFQGKMAKALLPELQYRSNS
jgi:hypothetical protein